MESDILVRTKSLHLFVLNVTTVHPIEVKVFYSEPQVLTYGVTVHFWRITNVCTKFQDNPSKITLFQDNRVVHKLNKISTHTSEGTDQFIRPGFLKIPLHFTCNFGLIVPKRKVWLKRRFVFVSLFDWLKYLNINKTSSQLYWREI